MHRDMDEALQITVQKQWDPGQARGVTICVNVP